MKLTNLSKLSFFFVLQINFDYFVVLNTNSMTLNGMRLTQTEVSPNNSLFAERNQLHSFKIHHLEFYINNENKAR